MHGGKDLSAYSLILPGGRMEMQSLRADEHFYWVEISCIQVRNGLLTFQTLTILLPSRHDYFVHSS